MQYYIVLRDYGRRYPGKTGPSGFEAVVSPEHTRRQIIEEVRDILNGARCELVHVKHVDGNLIEDVTEEFKHCAKWGDHVQAAE
jgi:hypothetical protein